MALAQNNEKMSELYSDNIPLYQHYHTSIYK